MRFILLFFIPILSVAQATQQRILVPVTGGQDSALLFLPDDYGTMSKVYPLLLFCQGSGEAADGGSAGVGLQKILNQVTAGGPANLIATGKWPSAILNPQDGNLYKFIIVSPQAKSGGLNGDDIDLIITYLVKNYRINISREYVMGISLGGGGGIEFASHLDPNESVTTHTRKNIIAGEIILSGATITPVKSWAMGIFADSIHIACFADPNNDTYGENDMNYVGYINAIRSGFALFVPNNYGHGGWSNIYVPSFLIPSLNINIYQWLLQWQAKGTVVVPPAPPLPPLKAVLSIDSTVINAYNSVVNVNADLSTIHASTGISWGQTSGPNTAQWKPVIKGTGMAIFGLIPGTYIFELGLTDSAGFDSAFVTVTVNPIQIPLCPICPVCPAPIICPVCPPPRTATGFSFVLVNGVLTLKFTYSDGNP